MIGKGNKLPLSIINPVINVTIFKIYRVQSETNSEYIGDSLTVSEVQFQLFDSVFKSSFEKALTWHNTIINTVDQTSKLVSSCHVHKEPSKQQTSYTIRVGAISTPVQNSSANFSIINDAYVCS